MVTPISNMSKIDFHKDYYGVLGVAPSADPETLKAVHRALAKKWHPDTFTGERQVAEARFQDICEAYHVLAEPVTRAQYDAARAEPSSSSTRLAAGPAHEPAAFHRALEERWEAATARQPRLETMRQELQRFSPNLAARFQLRLLNQRLRWNARSLQREMQAAFLDRHFGRNVELRAFARGFDWPDHRPHPDAVLGGKSAAFAMDSARYRHSVRRDGVTAGGADRAHRPHRDNGLADPIESAGASAISARSSPLRLELGGARPPPATSCEFR
jgi:curved DNA-binding protein CbpA